MAISARSIGWRVVDLRYVSGADASRCASWIVAAVIKAGRRHSLHLPGLIALAASVLAACAGGEAPPPAQRAAGGQPPPPPTGQRPQHAIPPPSPQPNPPPPSRSSGPAPETR